MGSILPREPSDKPGTIHVTRVLVVSVAVGVALGIAFGRVLSQSIGAANLGGVSLLGVIAVVCTASAIATLLPIRGVRAVDPVTVLR